MKKTTPCTLHPAPCSKGLTLIEALVVIGIMAVVAGFSVSYYRSTQQRSRLNDSASEMVQTLRRAQSRAMAAEGGEPSGVHFESAKFVLFYGSTYSAADPDNEDFDLPAGLEIYDISLNGAGDDVVFAELEGSTDDYGSISIRVEDDLSKTVSISAEGAVTWE